MVSTPYLNTIPAEKQAVFPGDWEMERRIKSYIRWNAMAMVVNANRKHNKKGRKLTLLAIACTSRPYPKGIVNSTTQDILHHMPYGVISSISKYSYTIHLCLCQAYFRLFETLLLIISRNTGSCFKRTYFRLFAMQLQEVLLILDYETALAVKG